MSISGPFGAERHAVGGVDDGLAGDGIRDLRRDTRGTGERDREHDDLTPSGRVGVRGRDACAGGCREAARILGITGRDDDVVPGATERGGQGLADFAGADDADIHPMILRVT